MVGDQTNWILDLETFQGFRDDRPKKEKWELIDGLPVKTPQPSLVHQRISGNVEHVLNNRLTLVKPGWRADREIGLLIPQDVTFNPEPDVTVIDTEIGMGQLYAERFYFVVEVLSGSDKPWVLKAKLAYYQQHEPCFSVLFVRQDQIAAELFLRKSEWVGAELVNADARLDLPVIGDVGPLSDLYRFTPLEHVRS
jgi:Uma2 family endonuclease